MPVLAADATATLGAWRPRTREQARLRGEYLAFVAGLGDDALRRDAGPEHVTASCFVLSPDLRHVLLTLHRKGGFWVQLGGHVEDTDGSLVDAAEREAAEEGGIGRVRVLPEPVDLDRHALSDRFGACRVHWDVGFVAFAEPGARPEVSDESDDVAWFDVTVLPAAVPPGFGDRLAAAVATVAERGTTP